ncbi:Os06g0635733 [Oryza sativa Japonica Group]|uniref:Os06g0635733 protein n=2 Tax=Oryza TaxID=4527 RepID=A0A0P0WZF3_ORYSJ|nr:Os06g0635733 [Oryza sativa Japonica Group]
MTPELATAAAAPLLEKPVLTIHDVVMATHFPNDVFSYIAGPSQASSSPPPTSSNIFLQAVIPPGSLQTNYAVHEAPDFDLIEHLLRRHA